MTIYAQWARAKGVLTPSQVYGHTITLESFKLNRHQYARLDGYFDQGIWLLFVDIKGGTAELSIIFQGRAASYTHEEHCSMTPDDVYSFLETHFRKYCESSMSAHEKVLHLGNNTI